MIIRSKKVLVFDDFKGSFNYRELFVEQTISLVVKSIIFDCSTHISASLQDVPKGTN